MSVVKDLLLATHLYRPARAVQRLLWREQAAYLAGNMAAFRAIGVGSGRLCFDVGANIGELSEAMLRLGARVVAFEPQLDPAREAAERCRPWSAFTLVRAAVGAENALLPLHVSRWGSMSSLLPADGEIGTQVVPVITLAEAVERFGLPYFLKIDVEGYEPQVLSTLAVRVPVISFEVHADALGQAEECFALLARSGPAAGNLRLGESTGWALPEWLPMAAIRERVGEFLDSQGYGDVFLRWH